MILSDRDIGQEVGYGDLEIEPYNGENLQPASYDLTLADEFIEYDKPAEYTIIDLDEGIDEYGQAVEADTYILDPGEFVLASTVERVSLPPHIAGEVKGRSSVGRLGVIPHTAGFVDPGFEGEITLEFVNHGEYPVALEAGMRCCQLVFKETAQPAAKPYGEKSDSKYQGQEGVTASRIEEDHDR